MISTTLQALHIFSKIFREWIFLAIIELLKLRFTRSHMETTAILTGIIGTITGSCGLLLGILNYFRDKPNIQLTLSWDMSTYGLTTMTHGQGKLWGVVSITNIGRRPIFFSHLHLELPGTSEYLLITEGLTGEKLQEGDPPKRYPVTQEGLEKYADRWHKIRAVVYDSTGKKYYSKSPAQQPSWAKTNVKE
jgi:hypothetical protein